MHSQHLGLPLPSSSSDQAASPVLWAHGWARTGADFYNVADALSTRYSHHLLDLPGHGQSAKPDEDWDTSQYADAAADWIKAHIGRPVIWVGHSFGGRVGLRLAAQHPELVKALVLVASAGLPRQRKGREHVRYVYRKNLYQLLKRLLPASRKDALRQRFSSADYLNAGDMRGIFLKTIAEDQSKNAATITCPVRLFYGSADSETPPEIGQRLKALIPDAQLTVLDGATHWDILTRGAPLITKAIVDLQATAGASTNTLAAASAVSQDLDPASGQVSGKGASQ